MIQSNDEEVVSYVKTYFWTKICDINRTNITWSLEYYFQSGLKNGNQQIINQLKDIIEWEEDHPWWKVFKEELASYPEIKYDPDKLPF